MSFRTLFDIPFNILPVYVLRCERWQNGEWQRITAPPFLTYDTIIFKKELLTENDRYDKYIAHLVAHATGHAERGCDGG